MSERMLSVIEPWLDFGVDLKNRRVFLYSPVYAAETRAEFGTDQVVKSLLWLDSVKKDAVELWINSPGGMLEEMWAIHDVIRTMRSDVVTVGIGNISSAACLLLAAGTGVRYVMPHASFMWHGGTTDITPDMVWPEARDRMAWEEREAARWIRTMAGYTKPPKARGLKARAAYWEKWTVGRELWLDAQEMIAHGIADEVFTR